MKKYLTGIVTAVVLQAAGLTAANVFGGQMTLTVKAEGGGYMNYHDRNQASTFFMYGDGRATIDWGDGSAAQTVTLVPNEAFSIFDLGTLKGKFTHTYSGSSADTYTITLTGDNIEELSCDGLSLVDLNVSGNPALKALKFHATELTRIDLSRNRQLAFLEIGAKKLEVLDVSHNTALQKLHCPHNNLTGLNVRGCSALKYLYCNNNRLTDLDLMGCIALTNLQCYHNRITDLDVSRCPYLTELQCGQSQLTSLDLTGNVMLRYISCFTANLSNSAMNDLMESLHGNIVPEGDKTIQIGANPGTDFCNTNIAASKGWKVEVR